MVSSLFVCKKKVNEDVVPLLCSKHPTNHVNLLEPGFKISYREWTSSVNGLNLSFPLPQELSSLRCNNHREQRNNRCHNKRRSFL